MRKSWIRWTSACLMAALLMTSAVPVSSGAAAKEYVLSESPLEAQAREWVSELAGDTPSGDGGTSFSEWRDATLAVSPLGPGTHSWLVLLKKKDKTVGYLVVHAREEGGFLLGEYGTGSFPPYSEQSLQLSRLQAQPAAASKTHPERLYVHPLQAAWKLTSSGVERYWDAWTGESLPVDADGWSKQAEATSDIAAVYGLSDEHGLLAERLSMASFDPYITLPWLTKKPIALSGGENRFVWLTAAVDNNKRLRYTAKSYERKLRQVWSVVGYDRWDDGQLYLALDNDEDDADRRYIPVELLAALGQFYR